MNRAAWVAVTTLPMTSGRAVQLADIALADADAARSEVFWRYDAFASVPGSLDKATAAVKTVRAGMAALARLRPGVKLADKGRALLRTQGDALYRESESYLARAQGRHGGTVLALGVGVVMVGAFLLSRGER